MFGESKMKWEGIQNRCTYVEID